MSDRYVLDAGGKPVPEADLLRWARWYETADRHVARDDVEAVHVSTVFLGLDHAFGGGTPVLWETMVFAPSGHPWDDYQERYTSREEAEAGHARTLAAIRRGALPQ